MLEYTEAVEVKSHWLKKLKRRDGTPSGEEAPMIDIVDTSGNRISYRLTDEYAADGAPAVGESVALVVNVRTFANARNDRDGKAYMQYVQDRRVVGSWDGKAIATAKIALKKAA